MEPTVFLVDDDQAVRDALELLLETAQLRTESFDTAEAFLDACDPDRPGCLVLDIRMPGMSGIKLQGALVARGIITPVIFLTGHGNVSMSAQAFRSGAVDFMEKPFEEGMLLERIHEAIRLDQSNREALAKQANANALLASLTPREREVMGLVVAGKANKEIAKELDLSHRTVETHRRWIMTKTGARSLADLIELTRASRGSEPN
ncbi:MAG: response regulator [Pseudomonadota bacterium]